MPETSRLVAAAAAVLIERFKSRFFRLEGIMVPRMALRLHRISLDGMYNAESKALVRMHVD